VLSSSVSSDESDVATISNDDAVDGEQVTLLPFIVCLF